MTSRESLRQRLNGAEARFSCIFEFFNWRQKLSFFSSPDAQTKRISIGSLRASRAFFIFSYSSCFSERGGFSKKEREKGRGEEKGRGRLKMRPKNYKGRCSKINFSKCTGAAKLYVCIQVSFAKNLGSDPHIIRFACNVPLIGIENNTCITDFCVKQIPEIILSESVCLEKAYHCPEHADCSIMLLVESRNNRLGYCRGKGALMKENDLIAFNN